MKVRIFQILHKIIYRLSPHPPSHTPTSRLNLGASSLSISCPYSHVSMPCLVPVSKQVKTHQLGKMGPYRGGACSVLLKTYRIKPCVLRFELKIKFDYSPFSPIFLLQKDAGRGQKDLPAAMRARAAKAGRKAMSTWASMAKRLNNKVWRGQAKEWMLVRMREARAVSEAAWSANTRAIQIVRLTTLTW